MAVGDALFYDPFTFRKHFKNIGRAYREQATTLIEICRLYAEASPKTYTEDDRLQEIFRLADAALTAAGKAKKGKTPAAADAFLCVRDEIIQFGSPPPRKDTPGDRRKKLPDPSTALENASKKDEKSIGVLSKITSVFSAPVSKGPIKKVNFVLLKSPHERRRDQLIVHQEVDNSTTTAEIIWRFSRYPENSGMRITPKQNPHFYLRLPEDAPSYGSNFHTNSLKDFGLGLDKETSNIYVLVDKSCRLFLDAAKPHIPRIFGNLWKPHQTVILKDVGGILESEDIVLSKIGKRQDYWHRPSITDSSHRRVQPDYSYDDSEIVEKPVGNWPSLVDAALRCENVDLMVRDRARPIPSADSGWKTLPSPEPSSASVPGLGDQTTPRQSTTLLPQQLPNTSSPSIGGSTLSPSRESSETLVNPSDISLPAQAEAVIRPQSVDRGIYHGTSRQSDTPIPQSEHSNTFPSIGASTDAFERAVNVSEVSLPRQAVVGELPQSIDSGIDEATPRQSVTCLPQLERTNRNTVTPSLSLGGSTLFAASTDSFETLVNTSGVSIPTAASKRPQSVDSGIGLQVELSSPDTLLTPPSSAPPSTLLVAIPSPLLAQDQEPQSAPPVRKWETPGNWFEKYEYDYETESWRRRAKS